MAQPQPRHCRLLSAVPGRQRWEVPALCNEHQLAPSLEAALEALPGAESCQANPLTGRFLLRTRETLSPDIVRATVEQVLSPPPVVKSEVSREVGAKLVGAALAVAALALAPEVAVATALAAGAWLGLRRSRPSSSRERPSPPRPSPPNEAHPLARLLSYRKTYRPQVRRAAVLTVTAKILDLAPPLIVGLGVDAVAGGGLMAALGLPLGGQLLVLGGLSVVVWGAESICEYLFRVGWEGFANRLQHDMRLDAYSHVQKMDHMALQRMSTGEVVKILNADVNQIERFFSHGMSELMTLTTNATLATLAVLAVAPAMAPFPLLPIPLVVWYSGKYQRHLASRMDAVQVASDRVNALLVNNILGLPTILSYTAESVETRRVGRLSQKYVALAARTTRKTASYNPFIRFSLFFGFGGTIAVGGYLLHQGMLTAGAFAFVMLVSQRVLWPLTTLTNIISNYERTMVGARRIFRILEQPLGPQGGDVELTTVKGHVSFDRVSFSYDGCHRVLDNFSLDFPAGKVTAIVGATGTGKTTLTRLLLHFYRCEGGRILLDGQDIRDLRTDHLRRAVGLVSQTSFIFDGSAYENILYGRPEATAPEVERAARLAEVHDFLEALPQGYQTPVEGRLSAGQSQRLCLARAILKDPPILILDEATSFVDNETEGAIRRSLERISQGRTIIIIAHRLSTVCFADSIVVLGHDGILERGNHQELLRRNGHYAGLWRLQTGIEA